MPIRKSSGRAPVDVEDRARRIVEERASGAVQMAHLREELAHLARTRARGGLIRHRRHPLDEARAEQPAEGHQHEAHGAVAADPVAPPGGERPLDRRPVDRIEDDHGLVFQSQLRCRIDPVTAPARCAQLRVHGFRVLAALAGNEDVAARERRQIVRVADFRRCLTDVGRSSARLRRRKERGLDEREIILGAHALDQHGTDHAAPADQARRGLFFIRSTVALQSTHYSVPDRGADT